MRLHQILEFNDFIPYEDPDDILNMYENPIAFIYKPGKIYYSEPEQTHRQIFDKYEELSPRNNNWLYGRVAEEICSFWNTEEDAYINIIECLHQLIKDGLIDNNAVIHSPFYCAKLEKFIMTISKQLNIDYQTKQDISDKRELHILMPQQKKQAMQNIGIQASRKSPWQDAAEQNKIVSPGNKWWATTSESKQSF